jgi:hypothetical protein
MERSCFLAVPAVILAVYKSRARSLGIFDVLCASVFLGLFSVPYTVERFEVLCHDPASPDCFPGQILLGPIFEFSVPLLTKTSVAHVLKINFSGLNDKDTCTERSKYRRLKIQHINWPLPGTR